MGFGKWSEENSGEYYYLLGSSHILAQDIPFCGPEKEGCVKSQPLKDSSCLVPCHGLYADIADDSGVQGVIKGMIS